MCNKITNIIIVCSFSISMFFFFFEKNISRSELYIFSNPITDDSEFGKIKFVNNIGDDLLFNNSEFSLPVPDAEFEQINDKYYYEFLSPMLVLSAGDGVVIEKNNKIKILHGNGMVSVYSGVDICGVSAFQQIRMGQPIGLSNDKLIFNFEYFQSENMSK